MFNVRVRVGIQERHVGQVKALIFTHSIMGTSNLRRQVSLLLSSDRDRSKMARVSSQVNRNNGQGYKQERAVRYEQQTGKEAFGVRVVATPIADFSKNEVKVWTLLSCNRAFLQSQRKVRTEPVIVWWSLALHYLHAVEQNSLNLTLTHHLCT